jgi:hypothetical protein
MSTATKQIRFASNTKPENYGAIRKAKPIVRHLAKRKAIEGVWYMSNLGQIFGPYSGPTMRSWLETDQIGPSLEIRMGNAGEFADLVDHFPNIDEAFCVPSMLCIYLISYSKPHIRLVYADRVDRDLTVENVIDRFLLGNKRSDADVWMGEYFVGKLNSIGMSMIGWNMEKLEMEMEKEMSLHH